MNGSVIKNSCITKYVYWVLYKIINQSIKQAYFVWYQKSWKNISIITYIFVCNYELQNWVQLGFRRLHSCETALVKMTWQWANNMDNGNLTGLVLLDLHKCFDIVNHGILIQNWSLYILLSKTRSLYRCRGTQ